MDELKRRIESLLEGGISGIRAGRNGELYANVHEGAFDSTIQTLSKESFILISLFCVQGFEGRASFTLLYVFEKRGAPEILVLARDAAGGRASSIAETFPSACWYEREIRDGFGVEFEDAFDKRRLFLHEGYPENFHPLLKSFKNADIQTNANIPPEQEYKFKKVEGEGVYEIPVGPVHAGIIEPGHFRFSVIGETIFNLEVRMFYTHRGIEKLAEGLRPQDCVRISESISGDETVTNSVAYCTAVEKISGIAVPERAQYLRTILLEMERMYSLLGDVAGIITDVAYPAGASDFYVLREEALRQNERLTGSRFMKNAITIGGLARDIDDSRLRETSLFIDSFTGRLAKAAEHCKSHTTVIDRLEKTGLIKKELIEPLNLTGPIARASGTPADTRIDHPYGTYGAIKPDLKTSDGGDVLSRFELKLHEINDSARIIKKSIKEMPEGEILSLQPVADGHALALVESARGQNLHYVSIKDGLIDRYKIRTASYCNWQAIEHAVLGNIVPDFPLINKSLNLSYAGCDL
ncbi:MAG: NADH-quinone oxidoreductase subunit C [Candidatus Altiarchaeota archaeon]|nr:NADH-quinone oxidoreductase subunit C [Candidatus Altiarchaeota archaeon]